MFRAATLLCVGGLLTIFSCVALGKTQSINLVATGSAAKSFAFPPGAKAAASITCPPGTAGPAPHVYLSCRTAAWPGPGGKCGQWELSDREAASAGFGSATGLAHLTAPAACSATLTITKP